jgi:hypothetical protein
MFLGNILPLFSGSKNKQSRKQYCLPGLLLDTEDETSVYYQIAQRYIPEDSTLNIENGFRNRLPKVLWQYSIHYKIFLLDIVHCLGYV